MKTPQGLGLFARLGVLFAILVGVQVFWLASAPASPVSAASGTLGVLQFSLDKTADNQPTGFFNSFRPPVVQVWITFDYKNVPAGTRMSRIIRFDTADISYGDLNCCQSTSGRYATALTAARTTILPEGGYEVVIFLDGVQAAIGGFEVRSLSGSGSSSSGNGNSNSSSDPTPTATS